MFSPLKDKNKRTSKFSETRYKPVSFLDVMVTKAIKMPPKDPLPEQVRRSSKANHDVFLKHHDSPTGVQRGFLFKDNFNRTTSGNKLRDFL